MTQRPRVVSILLLLLLLAAGRGYALAPASTEDRAIALSGLIRDGAGTMIDHALVLLTAIGGQDSVRTAVTDADGRYSFPDLPGGIYRLTAIRDGYKSTVGRVTIWAQTTMDLVLAPSGQPRPSPEAADWVISAPKRDILRELEPDPGVTLTAAARGVEAPSAPLMPSPPLSVSPAAGSGLSTKIAGSAAAAFAALDGVVSQSFSEAGPWLSPASEPASGLGSTTSLAVGTPVGGSTHWNVTGVKQSESLTLNNAQRDARQSSAERLRVSVQMDTAASGRLDMLAYYDRDALSYQLGAIPSAAAGDLGSARRAWGYDGGWAGQVGSEGSLDVGLSYVQSAVGGTASLDQRRSSSALAELPDDAGAAQSNMLTTARFSKGFGAHRMNVGVKAGRSTSDSASGAYIAPSPMQDPALYSEFGRGGWTVAVSAGESWTLAEPISFDYGFDVSRTAYAAGSQREAVVPQAGVTVRLNDSTSVRWVASYVAMVRDIPGPGGSVVSSDMNGMDPMGYRMQVDQKIGKTLSMVLDVESRPFYYESIGARWLEPGLGGAAGRLYVSDGAASVRELTLSVQGRPASWGFWTLGASAGQVHGTVAASIPDQALLLAAATDSYIRYKVAHLGGRIARSGTEVQVDLTRLDQSPGDQGKGIDYSDTRTILRVFQDLAFLHPGDTDWSILLSYSSYRPGTEAPVDPAPMTLLNLSRASITRLSGGVAVRF